MDLHMTVTPPSNQIGLPPDFEVNQEFEPLIQACCDLLSDTDCRFSISGFGQEQWPVDVFIDLATVIEQLPEARVALRQNTAAEIDLYEQGMERSISFSPQGDRVMIRCVSRTDWIPTPDTIYATGQDVDQLLANLARDFVVALGRASPALATLPAFAGWA